MLAPWEETWIYDGRWLEVHPPEGETYGHRWALADYGDDPRPRAQLAAAAPEMARLLRRVSELNGVLIPQDTVDEIRAVLRKAGVA